MKNSKKSLMHVLSMSVLFALSSASYAEIIVNPSSGNGSASLNWASDQASQLLNDDGELEASPQG